MNKYVMNRINLIILFALVVAICLFGVMLYKNYHNYKQHVKVDQETKEYLNNDVLYHCTAKDDNVNAKYDILTASTGRVINVSIDKEVSCGTEQDCLTNIDYYVTNKNNQYTKEYKDNKLFIKEKFDVSDVISFDNYIKNIPNISCE